METVIQPFSVQKAAELSFAYGKVGERNRLLTPEDEQLHALELARHTLELTQPNTGFCGDERIRIGLGDGTEDPNLLREQVVPKLLGGIGIASTKACVAADSPIVKGAKSFKDAYLRVQKVLDQMGEMDAGHVGCGASMSVESSVINQIPEEELIPGIKLFVPRAVEALKLIEMNTESKQQHLQDGLYGGWDVNWHVEQIQDRYPANLAYLAVDHDDHETKGHNGSSIYVVTQPGMGFAKNSFTEDTGQQAFSVTLPKMVELANKLGGSDEERARLLLAYADDTLHVSAGIVVKGMPVFVQRQINQ